MVSEPLIRITVGGLLTMSPEELQLARHMDTTMMHAKWIATALRVFLE